MSVHSHPPCGEHYVTEAGGLVFEIYQRRSTQAKSTGAIIRLLVDSLDDVLTRIDSLGGAIKRPPHDTEFGRVAIVSDPDGHTVFLTQRDQ